MRPLPVMYRGTVTPNGTVVEFQQVFGERWFPLDPRTDLRKVVDGGLSWGGTSGGSEQLALALAASRLPDAEALARYGGLLPLIASLCAPFCSVEWALSGEIVDAALRITVKGVSDG